MARGGKQPGAGNPGYGKSQLIIEGIESLVPRWFELADEWLNGKNRAYQRIAFTEVAKLMTKRLPQVVTGEDGGPVEFVIKHYDGNPTKFNTTTSTSGNPIQIHT